MPVPAEDHTRGTGRHGQWISPLGWALAAALIFAFVVIPVGLGRLLTDRLTVHNQTTVPISFTVDSFGGSGNEVRACDSSEFRWKQDGNRSGWTPADGGTWGAGGAVDIDIPVERWFEVQIPANHFMVLVTSEGVVEWDADSTLPPCEGEPPRTATP